MQSSKGISNKPQAPARNVVERNRGQERESGDEPTGERRSQIIWGKWNW